jgi:hypothetical protein
MGTEKIKTDTAIFWGYFNVVNNKGIAAAALIPKILAKTQIKNDLLR